MLRTLTLPLGTSASQRFSLTQKQVDTLIKVYYDQNITTKQVTGYVYKSSLTTREDYLLRQLGLNVAYDTLVPDVWTMTSDKLVIESGSSAQILFSGLTVNDVVMAIGSVTVASGTATEQEARACLTLSADGTLAYDASSISSKLVLVVEIEAYPIWNSEDTKTLTLNCGVTERTIWINPSTASASLRSRGDLTVLNDYVSKCKPYVFNSAGTQMAEIKQAFFEGNYSGMTTGSVIFADDTEVNINALNTAGCNFMVLRPAMHIENTSEQGEEVMKNTGVYDVLSPGHKIFPRKFIGMFKAFNQNGVLKSQPNRVPTTEQTIATFQSQAKQGGTDYGLWNYSDWCKENALHLSYFANTNYDVNVGTGRIGGDQTQYDRLKGVRTGFTLPLVGTGRCGTRATVDSAGYACNCLSFFNIEGMGEQLWEFVIGFRHNGSNTAYVWDANEWSESHAADRTFAMASNSWSGQYIKAILAGQHFDMLPRSVGASATTGFCDGHYVNSNGRLLIVGGTASNGSFCGLSASAADGAFSHSRASISARLAFYGSPTEVDGATLVRGLTA